MQHGKIVESGNHVELIDRGGLYSQMWLRQQHVSLIDLPQVNGGAAGSTPGTTGSAEGGTSGSGSPREAPGTAAELSKTSQVPLGKGGEIHEPRGFVGTSCCFMGTLIL